MTGKQYLNPPELFNSLQYGFSQMVVVPPGGRTVYLSGQVAWNAAQEITGGDDLGAQTVQAFMNLESAMQIAGGTLADVVALRIYIVARKLEDTSGVSAALKQFFLPQAAPATTWIGVVALARPEFLVEIEATAVIA